MKREHRVQVLQSTMKEITGVFVTPDLIVSLKDEAKEKQFWKEVDLKALVQWKIKK